MMSPIRKFCLKWRGLSVTLVTLGGSGLVIAFLLKGHAKNAIVYASSIQCVKGGAGFLFIQMDESESPTASCHDVRSQANRPDSTVGGKKPT
jgi:hypothetical protein